MTQFNSPKAKLEAARRGDIDLNQSYEAGGDTCPGCNRTRPVAFTGICRHCSVEIAEELDAMDGAPSEYSHVAKRVKQNLFPNGAPQE